MSLVRNTNHITEKITWKEFSVIQYKKMRLSVKINIQIQQNIVTWSVKLEVMCQYIIFVTK